MPRPRALGSTSRIRSWAVSSSRSAAEHATGAGPVDLGDPRLLASWTVVGEIGGDDLGDEGLERDVPSVLVAVDLTMALDDPAEIPAVEAAHGNEPLPVGTGIVVEEVIEGVDRLPDPPPLIPAERFEQGADLRRRAAIELGGGAPSFRRQRQADVAPVDVGPLRRDEAGALQSGHDACEVARVHAEPSPQFDLLARLVVAATAEFEQHPRLGQRVRRVEESGIEQPDDFGPSPVERSDPLDVVSHSIPRSDAASWRQCWTESNIIDRRRRRYRATSWISRSGH